MRHDLRRLAAILAADVAGYSRLMAADESGTLARLKRFRAEVIEPGIARFQGRIVGSAGDSLLIEFASVLSAVECAIEVQASLTEHNAGLPEDRRMAFRMGINLGDVIVESDTIHGEGVNIASRIEKLAEPGGLCIARNVHDQVKGKLAHAYVDLGEQHFHNIPEPVHVYRVRISDRPSDAPPGSPARDALALPDKPSIAVLAFENMSGDPEQEYFADGIVEEIITALSRMRSLFVIARNSSFSYKGRSVNVRQVGRELGVRYVLEGSVRKAGSRLRIAGQLIDAETGAHLWADRFDGTLDDVFDLQDQVTANVVGAIAPRMEAAEIDRIRSKPTESLDAYDHYLRGMAGLHKWSREGNDQALLHFYRAIELDPGYAAAHGLAARTYVQRNAGGWIGDHAHDVAEAERLARRAVELGPDDAVALCTAGFALADLVGDIDDGDAFTEKALGLNPNLAWAWLYSGWVKAYAGNAELAIERIARAKRLSPSDPQDFSIQTAMAFARFIAERYDDALACAESAIRDKPNNRLPACIAAASAALAGRQGEARKAMDLVRRLDPDLRIANVAAVQVFGRPEDFSRWTDGLRKAGLPE